MTRKDYKALAEIIKERAPANPQLLKLVAQDVASYCKATNPKFDGVRFMEACGYEVRQ